MGYEVEASYKGMKSWKLTKKQNENINELLEWEWQQTEQMNELNIESQNG